MRPRSTPPVDPEFLARFAERCAERRQTFSQRYRSPSTPEETAEAVGVLRREVHGLAGEAAMLGLDALTEAARALEAHLAHLTGPSTDAYRRVVAWCRRLAVAGERAGTGRRGDAEAAAIGAEIAAAEDESTEALPKRRILVFDDDRLVREILVDALADLGHTTASAGDLMSFEARLADFKPELILADMVMPDIGGDDVCRTLKTRFDTEGIPIVIMSGADDAVLAHRARAAGADGWVSKARGPEAVIARLEGILEEIVF